MRGGDDAEVGPRQPATARAIRPTVVAAGTPEQIAAVEESYTGQFLKKILEP